LVFTSDHGDEFGEEGKYFHQPQRRRTVDALTEVPVAFDGIELANDDPWISLLDIAPTILSAVGLDIPEEWNGIDHTDPDATRDHAITIAPWLDEATVSYKTRQLQLVASDSNVSLQSGSESTSVQASEVPKEVEQKLQDLGYVG
jgi:arylsulfatase A-like enzyme